METGAGMALGPGKRIKKFSFLSNLRPATRLDHKIMLSR
jgi:hypothetical protein